MCDVREDEDLRFHQGGNEVVKKGGAAQLGGWAAVYEGGKYLKQLKR